MGADDDPWNQPTGTTGPIDGDKAVETIKDMVADGARHLGNRALDESLDGEGDVADDALFEVGLALTAAANQRDRDHDGLNDGDEMAHGSNPRNPDTDGDRLPDGAEVHVFKSDPTNTDTDWDGRRDGDEAAAGAGIAYDVDGTAEYYPVPEVTTPHRDAPARPAAPAARPAPEPEADTPGPVLSPSEVDSPGPVTSPSQVGTTAALDDITGSDAVAMTIGGTGTTSPSAIVDDRPSSGDEPAPASEPAAADLGLQPADAPFEPAEVQFPAPAAEDPVPPPEAAPEGDFSTPVDDGGTAVAESELPPDDDLSFA